MDISEHSQQETRGFTLIELLVVIAIIGILSAVVLASLNSARSKGNDAAVKSNLDSLRSQAALYLSENGNYGSVGVAVDDNCAEPGTIFDSTATNNVVNIVVSADNANGPTAAVRCNLVSDDGIGATAYAVSAALVSEAGNYYCVDSDGVATTTATQLSDGDASCL